MPKPVQTDSVKVVHSDKMVRLSGTLNFETARGVLENVNAVIRTENELQIDLSDIGRSNSAGLALLVEWRAEAKRQGHSVQFLNVPDSLIQLSHVCQVNSLI